MAKYDVIVVGAGVSGLVAAAALQNDGLSVKVFEAADRAGGQVATDEIDGYVMDRGFQVMLTAYPEWKQLMDFERLSLQYFFPGVLVQLNKRRYRLADPVRQPLKAFGGFFNPFSNFGDRLKLLALQNRTNRLSIEDIFAQDEVSTYDYLKEWNFSDKMIDAFMRPFFGGVFSERDLNTSSRMFEFVYKMMVNGEVALPKKGMGAIVRQLEEKLYQGTIQFNSKVEKIGKGEVIVDGTSISCNAILMATDAASLHQLLPAYPVSPESLKSESYYFSADESPFKDPVLLVNGKAGVINHLAVPTLLHPEKAPYGKHLICVNLLNTEFDSGDDSRKAMVSELMEWFGAQVKDWELIKAYEINRSFAGQKVSYPNKNDIKAFEPGLYVCGEHTHDPSINGAIRSGRLVANTISWDLALYRD